MDKRPFSTNKAPRPAGPYSQGIVAQGFVFVAGQGAADAVTGELAEGIEDQTERALRNVEAILAAAGSSLAHAVKISVFLAELGDFPAMNAVYESLVPEPRPVRTTVEAGLPPGLLVEIDAVAVVAG
jgi:2-iminobutanoate/2-iminopropanoate deaminase